jgi:hypothetical protein
LKNENVTRGATDDATENATDIKKRAWLLEPHVCKKCFARIVSSPTGNGERLYQCTNCGAEATGTDASVLCCCGIKIKRAGKNGTKNGSQVDAGIRCIPNPEISPLFPSLFVASEVKSKNAN